MARRPTHDSAGRILPMRVRQPIAFWVTILTSVAVALSLVATSLLVLLS